MLSRQNRFVLWPVLVIFLFGSESFAVDWNQWRGPGRDGVWNESGVVEKFSQDRLQPLWRAEVAGGYSGPTVADGRVYVMDKLTGPPEQERVLCFNAETGDKIWEYAYDTKYEIDFAYGPRASVTVVDDRAFSLGSMGYAACFNAKTGEVLWEKDLKQVYNVEVPIWGISPSPLAHNGKVIYHIGGADGACVVALNAADGQEIWRALDPPGSYSSPMIIEQAGKPVMVVWSGRNIAGLNPDSGEVYWSLPFKPKKTLINIATPVYDGEHLYFSSFYDGSILLKVHPDEMKVDKVWERVGRNEQKTDALQSIISTPVMEGGYIYGVDSYGELRCLDKTTGDRLWENLTAVANTRWGTIHFVKNFDKYFMFNEAGELLIGKLTPQGFEEISRTQIIEPTTSRSYQAGNVAWSHPAFANRRLYVRNDKELLCVKLEE